MAAAGADELALALRRYAQPGGASSSTAAAATQRSPQQAYAESSYWETRFQDSEGVFDWYATYSELSSIFRDYAPPSADSEVLMVGCGNSVLSSELHDAGFRRVKNIDISGTVVEKMRERFNDLNMDWLEMDATAMAFEDGAFDVAIDKGTVDALAANGAEVAAVSAEIWRTLRPGGIFLLVSHNSRRLALLNSGVRERHGEVAAWECLEVRQCRLSPQVTFINVLRSKLKGRPLAEAFKDTKLLQEAAAETKDAMRKMAFVEAFREFKARKRRAAVAAAAEAEAEAGAAGVVPAAAAAGAEAGGSTAPGAEAGPAARRGASPLLLGGEDAADVPDEPVTERDPRLQPFCWCYVLRKPHS